MTTFQKIVKGLAITLAIFLSVNIISVIVIGIVSIIGVSNVFTKEENLEEIKTIISNNKGELDNINKLEIKLGYTNLEIKEAEEFKVETNNSEIKYKKEKDKLKLEEKRKFFDISKRDVENNVIIYIPSEKNKIKELDIETGAGESKISNIEVNEFSFEQGAGKSTITNLKTSTKTEIEGGAGELSIEESEFQKLDLQLGVGKLRFSGILDGKNKIETGIGEVNIELSDGLENYEINAKKGIGTIKIDEKEIQGEEHFGNGKTKINIKGGIGSIEIK